MVQANRPSWVHPGRKQRLAWQAELLGPPEPQISESLDREGEGAPTMALVVIIDDIPSIDDILKFTAVIQSEDTIRTW